MAYLAARPVLECSEPAPAAGEVTRRGTFVTRFHGVSDVIEELDSQQILLRDFSFDGQGIDVRV